MAELLPVSDLEFVSQAQAEYDSLFQTGTADEVDSARHRLVWALVHSPHSKHQQRGLEICRLKLQDRSASASGREFRYFAAVACYNQGKYIEARREVSALLQESPEFRQADVLKGLIEDAIVKEGLVGVGIGAAVLGVALAVIFSKK